MKNISTNYHDWYLQGIKSFRNEKRLEITLEYEENEAILKFFQVRECVINNFHVGNIILDIYTYEGEIDFDKIASSSSFLKFIGVESASPYFEKVVSEIRNGSLLYVEINTSYGCEGTILCEKIEEHRKTKEGDSEVTV